MENKNDHQTILVIVAGLLVLYFIFKINTFLSVALLLGLAGSLSNYLASKIAWLWLKIAEILGMIMPKVILAFVFFLILTPIAMLYRLFKKNGFQLRKNTASYYAERNHQFCAMNLENLW